MSAPGRWDRVSFPLALSLGGHTVLVAVCLWAPLCFGPGKHHLAIEEAPRGPFSLQFVQVREGPREALPSDGHWEPVVTEAPALVLQPPKTTLSGPEGISSPEAPGGGKGPGPRGGGTGPGLLAVGEQARRVVYLIDCSVSMGPTGAFARARAEVLASLRHLPPGTAFQVIAYHRTASPLVGQPHELLNATAAELDRVEEALQGCSPSGRTDHVQAVRAGLAYRPDVLFLLTDADDLTTTAARELDWLPTGGTSIHIFELSGSAAGQSPGPLARLAARSGGFHRRVRPD